MGNLDKANSVAIKWVESMGGLEAIRRDHDSDLSGLMQALEAAGLLSPDLPEPDGPSTLVPAGVAWNTPQDSIVWTALGGRVVLQWVSPGNFTPHEARELALAVLSAADYAEKGQSNE